VSTGERLFAAAYVFGLAVVLAYVVVIALRLARVHATLEDLERLAATPPATAGADAPQRLERESPPPATQPPAAKILARERN
jgi:hypothetical protein